MAETQIGNKIIDLLTRGDMRQEIREARLEAEAEQQVKLAGVKPIRFKIQGAVASNAFQFGGDAHQQAGGGGYMPGPEQGYVWNIRHLVIMNLTSGTTPDVCNIYRSGDGLLIWQLNGNQFAQTFSRGEMLLFHGESLLFQNSGSVTAAAGTVIIAHGMALNEPAQMVGKSYV